MLWSSSAGGWMVFIETERGRRRVARSVRQYVSTLAAEIAKVSAKNASRSSAEISFGALLILFAADAERRLGARFQALDLDLFLALLARAERPLFDLL